MEYSVQEVFNRFGNIYLDKYNNNFEKKNVFNKVMYDLLFKISSDVVLDCCYEHLGINVGITSILHTWSQKGKYYPHIHMLVTGGGINKVGKWEDSDLVDNEVIRTRFKNRIMSSVKKKRLNFYGKFSYLNHYDYYIKHIDNINNDKFICYKKEPYNSVNDIYEYFAKYAFRVWISNERTKNIDDKYVYFSYKDYDNKNKDNICRIKGEEFIRRFLTHTLTKNFVKIRYYGIMSCKNKSKKIKKLKIIIKRIKDKLISKIELLKKILNKDINKCPKCNGKLVLYKEIKPNKGPPKIKNKDILVNFRS